MTGISAEELNALSALALRDPPAALRLLREYDCRFARDVNFWINSGGFLIDIGTDMEQPPLVQEGIARIESLITHIDHFRPIILYNLANGYSGLYSLERRLQGDQFHYDPDAKALFKAKKYYRQALAQTEAMDRDLRAQLWVNYGNCLSALGRAVEAISAYDNALQVFPDHPMARGNLGVELDHFAYIANHSAFLLDAYEMLEQALADKRLEEYGGPGARAHFEHTRQRIASGLSALGIGTKRQEEPPTIQFSSNMEREYAEFCARHQLSLSFCLRCRRCSNFARDSLSFSLTTSLDDDTSFVRLSRVVNEIKERYAFARFLLFQAIHPLLDTIPIDQMTAYADNLDYAVYGTRVASVKTSFESAYNVLDKIAHFINGYLRLGLKPNTDLAFSPEKRLWHERGSDSMRPALVQLQNWHLFGLYDLAQDLHIDSKDQSLDGDWGKLRRTRNALTHEYLIPHVEGLHWESEADGPARHIYYRHLIEQTIALMQLVRAGIIYLIAFIDQEERKRRSETSGFIAPMYQTQYDAALFSSSLDQWIGRDLRSVDSPIPVSGQPRGKNP